jgi:hypothetical protein
LHRSTFVKLLSLTVNLPTGKIDAKTVTETGRNFWHSIQNMESGSGGRFNS